MRTTGTVIVLVAILAACASGDRPSPSAASPTAGLSVPSLASIGPSMMASPRRTLPSGFPVFPGAVALELPADDPGLIGLWEADRPGSAAYDFYVDALPAAGYQIVGLYPGGAVALIRFDARGEVWQMVARGTADWRVAIEIRLDRP